MKIEFHRAEEPDVVVATATWDGSRASIESGDDEVAARLWHVFRPTPVVVDDPSYRSQGTSGEVVVQPGSMEWFRTAAQVRASETGLVARVVPGVTKGGFDPAAGYRTFHDTMDRLVGDP